MTSIAGMALCTIVVALIPAYYDITVAQKARFRSLLWPCEDDANTLSMDSIARRDCIQELEANVNHQSQNERADRESSNIQESAGESNVDQEQPRHLALAETLLGNLCDLQLFTATAIVTAAFAQGANLSFYHQSFVLNYWWLTLNSFWASRQDEHWSSTQAQSQQKSTTTQGLETDEKRTVAGNIKALASRTDMLLRGDERFRSWFRRLLVFCCTAEFIVFAGLAIWKQDYGEWDALGPGRCYISHDKSTWQSDWFWLAGVCIYALIRLVILVSKTKIMLEAYSENLQDTEDWLFRKCIGRWVDFRAQIQRRGEIRHWGRGAAAAFCCFLVLALTTLIFSALIQFAAIWSFGDGFYALEVAFYIGMWAWSFYDIVDLKISNQHLLTEPETAWGFGQVLAVVLMGMIVFNLIDAFHGE